MTPVALHRRDPDSVALHSTCRSNETNFANVDNICPRDQSRTLPFHGELFLVGDTLRLVIHMLQRGLGMYLQRYRTISIYNMYS